MSLPTRQIGKDSVTALGYGAMSLSPFYGTPRPEEEQLKASISLFNGEILLTLALFIVP